MGFGRSLLNAPIGALAGIGAAAEAFHLGKAIYDHFADCHSVGEFLSVIATTDDVTRIGLAATVVLIWGTLRGGKK